ncbi:MAG: hypothetical protein AAFP22_14670 [Planctomycetota bacterium]
MTLTILLWVGLVVACLAALLGLLCILFNDDETGIVLFGLVLLAGGGFGGFKAYQRLFEPADPAAHLLEQLGRLESSTEQVNDMLAYFESRQTSLVRYFQDLRPARAEVLEDDSMRKRAMELARADSLIAELSKRSRRMQAEVRLFRERVAAMRANPTAFVAADGLEGDVLTWMDELEATPNKSASDLLLPASLESLADESELGAFLDRSPDLLGVPGEQGG